MPGKSEKARLLNEVQHQERARWLFLAALAREYHDRVKPLLAARGAFEEVMGQRDEAEEINRLTRMFALKRRFTPRLRGEPPEHGWHWVTPTPLELAIGEWAEENGLMVEAGYRREQIGNALGPKIPIRRPALWLGEYALKLLEAQASSPQDVERLCVDFSGPFHLSFDFKYQTKEQEASYPQPPEISAFVPRFQTRKEFLAQVTQQLEKYADEMLLWSDKDGQTAEVQRRASDTHFRWLAWYICEGLTATEILERAGRHDGDESTVRKALFGKGGLTSLTGFVKESD